ncbi:MAG: type II CAAX endopeptidase family protein [Kiritimatiellae bacterium]|nr:type II CAAX endopeptidase family protein [Kiritimatiellia bacterium]MDD5520392.1 type II CAAX endopeptidase family protein [Kiritimatiellia bacterium]
MFETIDIDAIPLPQAILVFLADPLVLLCIAIDLLMLIYLMRNPPDWRHRAEKLNSRPWSVREAETMLLAIIMFILAGRTVISTLYDLGKIQEDKVESWILVTQTILFHLPVIALVIALLIRNRTISTGILGYQPRDIISALRRGAVFCLAALPIVGFASLIQNHFLTKAGFMNEPQYVIELFNNPGPLSMKVYLIIVTIITAPIAEEFIFRGIGISVFADKIGMKWSVFLISIAFATIHFNLYSFVPLFTIAMAFSIAYIYTGSLLVSVCMHSVFNTLNIIALVLSGQNI